jgi:hypothetical protein
LKQRAASTTLQHNNVIAALTQHSGMALVDVIRTVLHVAQQHVLNDHVGFSTSIEPACEIAALCVHVLWW